MYIESSKGNKARSRNERTDDKRGGADPDDMDSLHAALSLRYYWAGKLHEKNKRFSPIYDYADAKHEARNIAIEGDDYIERVIDFLPVP